MNHLLEKYLAALNGCQSRMEASAENLRKLNLEEAVRQAVELIHETTRKARKVIFIGNGGSAAIASHQAVDLWKNGGVRAVAFNDASLLTCISNDFGYEHVFEKPVEMFAERGDVLIAISSSGSSRNILQAVEKAREKGCAVITLSGFQPDNPLRRKGDVNFYIPSDSYGLVEISHLTLCHCIADQMMERNQLFPRTGKKVLTRSK